MPQRCVTQIIQGQATSDGAGVKLTRIISPEDNLDPFLLLDAFDSEDSADYLAGFPAHPHRGFETVTYMLEGAMLHEDHLGNRGYLGPGSVQWMTAARGIIHSEMPRQIEGRMRGFQLWLNLPAADKMNNPSYRDIIPAHIPEFALDQIKLKMIAGQINIAGQNMVGAVQKSRTEPIYVDVQLDHGQLELPLPLSHSALVYVYEGTILIAGQKLNSQRLAVLSDGDIITLTSADNPARLLLLAAKPLHEPIVHYGSFVMNSQAEIAQAVRDYQTGRLTA